MSDYLFSLCLERGVLVFVCKANDIRFLSLYFSAQIHTPQIYVYNTHPYFEQADTATLRNPRNRDLFAVRDSHRH